MGEDFCAFSHRRRFIELYMQGGDGFIQRRDVPLYFLQPSQRTLSNRFSEISRLRFKSKSLEGLNAGEFARNRMMIPNPVLVGLYLKRGVSSVFKLSGKVV